MKKIRDLLFCMLLMVIVISPFVLVQAKPEQVKLLVIEYRFRQRGPPDRADPPETDNSMANPDYKLLGFYWHITANYYINPKNSYGFTITAVVDTIMASANTWDSQTSYQVFYYVGTTTKSAGKYDGYNVVSWGAYRAGVIAVTYIWYSGNMILETDTRLNTLFKWSLTGEAKKMDVQNIMTHEFGHWCGLDDLYDDKDYWLTMYGYADYGETYKQSLGLGDILGLQFVYGS
jgi:hypothetical protein